VTTDPGFLAVSPRVTQSQTRW